MYKIYIYITRIRTTHKRIREKSLNTRFEIWKIDILLQHVWPAKYVSVSHRNIQRIAAKKIGLRTHFSRYFTAVEIIFMIYDLWSCNKPYANAKCAERKHETEWEKRNKNQELFWCEQYKSLNCWDLFLKRTI